MPQACPAFLKFSVANIVSSPSGIRGGGNDFCVISQAGGATAKLQEPGWEHIQVGEDDFRQSSGREELLYHDELLVFPQNASPRILQISPAALSYIFLTFSQKGIIRSYCFKIIENH